MTRRILTNGLDACWVAALPTPGLANGCAIARFAAWRIRAKIPCRLVQARENQVREVNQMPDNASPLRELWSVGSKIPLNVYEGARPVCQCHNEDDARRIVAAMNRQPAELAPENYACNNMLCQIAGMHVTQCLAAARKAKREGIDGQAL